MKVLCICSGVGFPFGTASTKRILLMGKALVLAGNSYHVLHVGPSCILENVGRTGCVEGVSWCYLTPSVRRPSSTVLRMLYYFWGLVQLPYHLWKLKNNACVYVYCQGDMLNAYSLVLCKLLGLPAAQECCEWWPGTGVDLDNILTKWVYDKCMFQWSNGALPISKLIEERIFERAYTGYSTLRVPVLVDAQEVYGASTSTPSTLGACQPYFLWCGMVDGYIRDPELMIAAIGQMVATGLRTRLVLCGPCSDRGRKELYEAARGAGVEPDDVVVTGFVSDAELHRLVTHAVGLLLPMWEDDRSKTRFPTKLGLYAAAGRPILSCAVGEISQYLEDEVNASFFHPGAVDQLAYKMSRTLNDSVWAAKLGTAVRRDVAPKFDYRNHAARLDVFYKNIALSR